MLIRLSAISCITRIFETPHSSCLDRGTSLWHPCSTYCWSFEWFISWIMGTSSTFFGSRYNWSYHIHLDACFRWRIDQHTTILFRYSRHRSCTTFDISTCRHCHILSELFHPTHSSKCKGFDRWMLSFTSTDTSQCLDRLLDWRRKHCWISDWVDGHVWTALSKKVIPISVPLIGSCSITGDCGKHNLCICRWNKSSSSLRTVFGETKSQRSMAASSPNI